MTRMTIDFGIDLGTTNSTIARLDGISVSVVKNNENQEITPSAVFVDRKGALIVGREAKEQLRNDRNFRDVHLEFKLQMGTDRRYEFPRSGTSMLPEELSAEVIRALRADVRQRYEEDITSAVITVPAAFDLPQCDATRRAATIAGLSQTPLLQEPVAAAMAYGFQSESDKVFWLVYDLGGGTFDAAVIQVLDGSIHVVNHGGDNHLGGKLIDWDIVEKILVPAARASAPLTDFHRGNKRWDPAMLKLKYWAEQIKVKLSRQEVVTFSPDNPFDDDQGEPVEFELDVSREQLARLAAPHLRRSISIARDVLKGKGLGPDSIQKVLLVGGPTLAPYVRELVADDREGLGIPLEHGIDSITVVAQGAAVFAGTQRCTADASRPIPAGSFAVELEYKPVGPDPDPLVGGRVRPQNDESLAGFSIEFINRESQPMWRSGRIPLSTSGTFVTNLWAEKGRANSFAIDLYDPTGNRRETVPPSITYTVGLSISQVPLTHNFGVALANNSPGWFFEKGTPLPAKRGRVVLRTTSPVVAGDTSTAVNIPLIEGESEIADRNNKIGHIKITGDRIKRDLPFGSEVELSIEIDESRIVSAIAYVPFLDEEFEDVLQWDQRQIVSAEELEVQYSTEQLRLEELSDRMADLDDPDVSAALDKVETCSLPGLDSLLHAARTDDDAAQTAQGRLTELAEAIDRAERLLEWPSLVAEAEESISRTSAVIEDYGEDSHRREYATLVKDLSSALELRHVDLTRKRINDIDRIRYRLLQEQPSFWVGYFNYLDEQRDLISDSGAFTQWASQAKRAIENEDVPSLRNAVLQLAALLPEEQKAKAVRAFGSTVTG